jgi:hypothetical protein
MKILLKGLSAGGLSLASWGALSTSSAIAASINVTSIGGSAPTDYLVYDANAVNTFAVLSSLANVQNVLDGDATKPTGNVELRAKSEQAGFDFTKNTTLEGTIGGKSIILSSLTESDWFSTGSGSSKAYGANNLATTWFNALLTAAGQGGANLVVRTKAYNLFLSSSVKGFERTSDPNISYVNQDDATGVIKIGLAGHFNLVDAYAPAFASIFPSVQASEVVKYTYDNSQTGYLYSFNATKSGLVSNDLTNSHNGNYEVTFQGAKPVPVPAAFVGIAVAGVIGAAKLKRQRKV